MFRFEKLDVWQKSVEFADRVYAVTKSFPSDERFGLTSQMRRAAVSISSNIAEGSGGSSDKDFAHFLEIAYGSSTLSVRGFVPESALSQPQSMGWGSGGFGYGARKNPPEETLTFPRGACLYSEPWGEVIGVLRHPLNRTVHVEIGDTAAWRELDLRWADARVWVPREGATAERPAGAVQSLSLENGFSCRPPPTR